MSGLDKDRLRNQTVCFRTTLEERRNIEARIKVSGMPKGEYYIQSLLHQQINIVVGKYQSDRLSIEIRRLRDQIEKIDNFIDDNTVITLMDCKALLSQLLGLMEREKSACTADRDDFRTKK